MWCTTFGRVAPTKFGRAKNVQNSGRFLTTVDFDREYLRNPLTRRQSEKHFINYISSPVGEVWSTINIVIAAHVEPPSGLNSGP